MLRARTTRCDVTLGTPLPWLAALLVAYLLVPIGAFLVRLAEAPADQLTVPGIGDALGVSVVTATVATVVIAVGGIPLGYLLARARGRAAELLGVAVQLPLALPPLVSGLLLVYVIGPYTALGGLFGGGLTDDLTGVVLAQVFVAAPFLIIAARSAFAALDPELADVAATLGHGRWSRFARVALPGAWAGIRAGLLLAWLRAFGEFGATVVLAYHPYSLPVFTYVEFGSSGVDTTLIPVAAALLAAVVVLALSGAAGRRYGGRHARVAPPPPRAPAARPPERLGFDLDARLGGFHLRVGHSALSSHLAVLGPSGAGKSLMLKLLAGLAPLREGAVHLGGHALTGLDPERRDVGYVPQDSCLLPHLPVWSQITFGVGTDPAVAAHWLTRLHLDGLEDRLPHQLSGGQRRRVALARALARQPRLLLLDEPFTGLDTPVRDELRRELRRVQRDTAVTTVLVTHDPEEAALLADEVLLVADGALLQSGCQPEVFAHPAGPAVARLLGIRNLHAGRMCDAGTLESAGTAIATGAVGVPAGTDVEWCVRPEHVELDSEPPGAGEHGATIIDVVHMGAVAELLVVLDGGCELTAVSTDDEAATTGARCRVRLPPERIVVWPMPADRADGPAVAVSNS
ncbi:ATP-binding cassette domain-containing protein [Pseudonocardia sp. CA-142604]|uniref:ABC transporter ATP-binding protein/permease n=1 Tax=Pseudonocardia sp. CA-142604 TaxID=3240024 RepID=UPI003D8C73EA